NTDKSVTFHWRQDKPHVSYLVTLVVGRFDVVREEWQGLPVLYYVPKGHKDDVARTFGRTRDMLAFFSKRFGVDYPWEKYAQVVVEQFTAGGMENTSAMTLTEFALHDQRSMLDSSPDGLIAHELAQELFWRCIQRYRSEHKFRSADTADFRKTLERETGRSLERFFYDWTERPGNPVLEINTEYLPDTKQARVGVKQTQAGEAYHFPLKVVFCIPEPKSGAVASGATNRATVFEQEIMEKEHVFFVPLAARPVRIDVDPDQAVL